jgi:murein DD-endopeptidase MepM/ murein hydrolase activator NlpD
MTMFKVAWPCEGTITSRFGWRLKPKAGWHSGIDIANDKGTPVKAAYRGTVVFAGMRGRYGLTVIIRHPNIGDIFTLYAHLDKVAIHPLVWVEKGSTVGLMGSTGYSTGNHTHFEVRVGFNNILAAKNPERYLT